MPGFSGPEALTSCSVILARARTWPPGLRSRRRGRRTGEWLEKFNVAEEYAGNPAKWSIHWDYGIFTKKSWPRKPNGLWIRKGYPGYSHVNQDILRWNHQKIWSIDKNGGCNEQEWGNDSWSINNGLWRSKIGCCIFFNNQKVSIPGERLVNGWWQLRNGIYSYAMAQRWVPPLDPQKLSCESYQMDTLG